jgi:hypothetical protein
MIIITHALLDMPRLIFLGQAYVPPSLFDTFLQMTFVSEPSCHMYFPCERKTLGSQTFEQRGLMSSNLFDTTFATEHFCRCQVAHILFYVIAKSLAVKLLGYKLQA